MKIYMNKEEFKTILNAELKELSKSEVNDLINILIDNLSSEYYEFLLCKIKYFKNEKCEIDEETLLQYNYILDDFEKISNGEICFRSYSYETETYSYYDADVDYVYYPSSELRYVFNETYNLIKKLILYKEYSKVITLFEKIIYTNYTCEEVGNPEYDDSDEVYDSYEVDFKSIKNDLKIDLNKICLYAIYSLIMNNLEDKFERIYNYTKLCYNINIRDVENIGIEKINDFEKFYTEWSQYLNDKSENRD